MKRMRFAAVALALLSCVLVAVACSSKKPKVETAPDVAATVKPTPVPSPISDEVEVKEPATTTTVSEEVSEELPDDIVALNSRGYLSDVFFATDRFDLSLEARDVLAANTQWLKEHASIRVLLEGHCDERNTRDYNLALGERRAATVSEYLASLGVAAARVQIISYGEEKPFAQGHDEAAWQLNRRVHFVITSR
jgi:peptidoglycan-associated lipoprotein